MAQNMTSPDNWPTGMRLHQAEDFTASGRLRSPPWQEEDRAEGVMRASIRMRRVGWLDQKGRVWVTVPPAPGFDGGSLTPLLIQEEE
jgi:hypothetical protein